MPTNVFNQEPAPFELTKNYEKETGIAINANRLEGLRLAKNIYIMSVQEILFKIAQILTAIIGWFMLWNEHNIQTMFKVIFLAFSFITLLELFLRITRNYRFDATTKIRRLVIERKQYLANYALLVAKCPDLGTKDTFEARMVFHEEMKRLAR